MSKSSTATLPKIPTQLPQKSAWAKGPPQNTAAPSPRSQSPAPSNAPHLTHSRRSSALGQSVPIKDGVSIPRSNVGAVKQGSAVTFGSIDDASAPISSSPAATPALKSEGVKSFGSVPATEIGHVNGKASISKPPSAAASASASTSSTPPPSATAPPAKIKMDVRMFFQNPSSPAPPSQPETSSPSVRTSTLPQQTQQPQNPSQPPSQPSQFGSHPYPTFVPGGPMRPPSQQNSGASGSGRPPPSPSYPRQPMANGNAPRPPNGPAGPGGAPLSSPRMSQMPAQQGMPPQQMPQQMPPQMQPQMWQGYYQYPGMPVEQAPYMYPGPWFGMPQQHGMPPQQQQMQAHPPPPVQQQHSGMPMSPRNHPIPLHSGPGTPTPSHAVPTNHAPPPLSQHHSSSSSTGGLSSPPPTPSSARLNTNASPFLPGGAPRPTKKIVFKSADGTEIKLENLKQQTQTPASTPSSTVTSLPSSTPAPAPSPGHNHRKSVQVRMESEEAKKKRIAEEEEKVKAQAEAEEKERREKEEKERVKKEEVEKEKKRVEEEERKRKEEEERVRLDEQRKKEEEAKAEAEEKERKEKEEKERLQREEEERLKKAEEEARLKKAQEEAEAAASAAEAAAAAAAASSSVVSTVETEEPASISEEEEGEVQETSSKETEEAEQEAVKEKPRDALRIDTASPAPAELPSRRRPGPLDLTNTKTNIPAPLPSALATARIIDDLSRVTYPENIQSPKVELNVNAKDGKFRYDRDFLLQFMSICKEKPDNLPPLDAIGIGPVDQGMTRTTSNRGGHRPGRTPSMSGPSGGPNSASGFPQFGSKVQPPFSGGIGNFKLSSQERYELASGSRTPSGSSTGAPFGRPAAMTRTSSQPGVSSGLGKGRTRSKRGETRDKNNASQGHMGSGFGQNSTSSAFENPSPLQATANRWDRKALGGADPESPELVDRKVKGLLNKLTMEKFDSISDQIIEWANKSEKEKDGRTLIQVIRLVFEKATDEATWSEMYARLCRKMMEQISPKVQDDGIKNAEGKPIAGGQLFRKYLLNRCQEDFERGWVAKEATAAAAATKALEDKAAKAANDKASAEPSAEGGDEIVLYSDEYYAAQKAKRQGLGLIKFIGELFKLQMLTERIMHECVKKLLGNVENPEEEEIESLCKLISTVGSLLDTQKARAHMDVYFSRMKELGKSSNVSSRMQFMLQDVIELRERKWVTRTQVAAPSTIAAVHEAAAKEKATQEKESYQRQSTMSRGGSRRGADRGEFQGPGPDGWTVAAGNTPRPPPKAGDLSNFGKISSTNKGLPMTFGPSSVFSGKKDKRESLSRTNSSSNMFSMLSQGPEAPETSKAAPEAPAQRRRLILQPRTKPADGQEPTTADATPAGSDDEEEEEETAAEMSEEDANKKIAEDSKEFFAVRNLDEAEVYFSALPAAHHFRLVDKLVGKATESKEVDAQLVADFFTRAVAKELCSVDAFEEGFSPLVEILEDMAIDAPKAPNNMALMMKSISFDDERTARIAGKSMDADKLLALLS
ncbi:hypothetical protein FB45DRAFT_1052162 [Roridomyces roridus]|uniref:MI domain-containing protein n=1 Tax=Roridomyces roridus TaxID=1738132 RepID=A0AAD7G0E7_9AGAR|nr:hypothetical protein FB45DRAFT_1052162 [Roridomyces roridus]